MRRGLRAGSKEERAVENLHARPRVPVKRPTAEQSDVEGIVAHLEHPAFGLDAPLGERRELRVKLALQLTRPTGNQAVE